MNKAGIIPENEGVRLDLDDHMVKPTGENNLDLLQVVLSGVSEATVIIKPVYKKKKEIIDFVILLANEKAARVLSNRNGSLRGKRLLKVFPGLQENGSFDVYTGVISSGKNAEKELVYSAGDTTRRCMQYIRKYQSGIVVTFSDITNTEAPSHGINVSGTWTGVDEFIGRLTTTLPDLVYVYDIDSGRNIYSNRSTLDMLGYVDPPEELKQNAYGRLAHPEDLSRLESVMQRLMTAADGELVQNEFRMLHADGKYRWMISRSAVFKRDKEGNVIQLIGVLQDITDRWMAGEKLRRSEALLQEAQRMAKLGSWEWDVITNEVTWTDELYRMYGYKPNGIKVSYDTYLEHVHPDDKHVIEVSIRSTLVTQYPFHNEFRIIRPDGEERIISSTGRVITNESGKVEKMLGICLDITERRSAEQEIRAKTIDIEAERRINKKKDEFISIASHELKTPLTSLKAYIQLLDKLNWEKSDQKAGSFLSKAGLYVKRLEGLISDLLDVSKMESGRLQFTMEEFDLNEFLEESLESNRLTLTRHTLVVSNEANVRVKGDRQRLDQVISNIIANAARYSPKADVIELSTTTDGHKVTIAVKDFGMGIESSYLTRIFDRFYRAENAPHNIAGLGLGLYISSEIVKRHDGRIWAESETGKGSTFYFTLPVLK